MQGLQKNARIEIFVMAFFELQSIWQHVFALFCLPSNRYCGILISSMFLKFLHHLVI